MNARKHNSQAGTVLVEAAFTLLLLFIFLLGIIEAGRFLNVQQVLTNAAREGARMAVEPITQTNCAFENGCVPAGDIEAAVQSYLDAANITNATVSSSTYTDADGMRYTTVRVTAPYTLITMSMFSSLQVTLEGQARMRDEIGQN